MLLWSFRTTGTVWKKKIIIVSERFFFEISTKPKRTEAHFKAIDQSQVIPAPPGPGAGVLWRGVPRPGQGVNHRRCAFPLHRPADAAGTHRPCPKGSELPRADRYKRAPCALSPHFRGLGLRLAGFAGGRTRVLCKGGPAGPRAGYPRYREQWGTALPRSFGARPGWDWPLGAAVPAAPARGRGRAGTEGPVRGWGRGRAAPPALRPGTAAVRHSPCLSGEMHHFRAAAELTSFIPPLTAFDKSNPSV